MSYFCADVNGYLDDLASIGGLSAFRLWATQQGGLIHDFMESGYTYEPKALAQALSEVEAHDAYVDHTRRGLLTCAKRADGVLILSDGLGDEDSLPNENKDEELALPPDTLMPPTYYPGPSLVHKDDLHVAHDLTLFLGLVKAAKDHEEPELKRALLHAFKAAAGGVSMTELQVGVRRKDWDAVLEALSRGNLDGRVREVIEPTAAAAYLRGVHIGARPLQRLGVELRETDDATEKAGLRMSLTRMNAHAGTWARSRAAVLVDEDEETKALIRDFVTQAVEDGFTVDEIADMIQSVIGLDARRGLALENFAANLMRSGLRGSEFEEKFDDHVDSLLDSRAETIARTEILMATNAGQQGLWDEALSLGVLDRSLRKIWIITDDETLCDECGDLADADPVDIDETFEGGVAFPPLHPNCRCTMGLVEDEEKAVADSRWKQFTGFADAMTQGFERIASALSSLQPKIDVHVAQPEAAKVEVKFEPVINVTSPDVHVAAPEVHVAAPHVEVKAPPAPEVKIDVHVPPVAKKDLVVERDPLTGRVKGLKER